MDGIVVRLSKVLFHRFESDIATSGIWYRQSGRRQQDDHSQASCLNRLRLHRRICHQRFTRSAQLPTSPTAAVSTPPSRRLQRGHWVPTIYPTSDQHHHGNGWIGRRPATNRVGSRSTIFSEDFRANWRRHERQQSQILWLVPWVRWAKFCQEGAHCKNLFVLCPLRLVNISRRIPPQYPQQLPPVKAHSID